jgi:hypothetical protein
MVGPSGMSVDMCFRSGTTQKPLAGRVNLIYETSLLLFTSFDCFPCTMCTHVTCTMQHSHSCSVCQALCGKEFLCLGTDRIPLTCAWFYRDGFFAKVGAVSWSCQPGHGHTHMCATEHMIGHFSCVHHQSVSILVFRRFPSGAVV